MSTTQTITPIPAALQIASRRAMGWVASSTDAIIAVPMEGQTAFGRRWSRYCWAGGGWVRPVTLRQGMILVDVDINTNTRAVMAAWLTTEGDDILHRLAMAEDGAEVAITLPSRDVLRLPRPMAAWMLEYLCGPMGMWTPSAESTIRTGFRMRPVTYISKDEAEEAQALAVSCGCPPGRIRVAPVPVEVAE